ncbi:thiamine phosphate synthase [Kangiella marina]|uniref:Thiamine-phosphate synthase n=1 Tax=Kangiella marina TaxID=1079178 RepID=A0ABP8IJE5_9GAMM
MVADHKPVVWTVAGSDTAGLAGQVADVRAMEALSVHPCMITTAVTAQNNHHVIAVNPLTYEQIAVQFEALKTDFFPAAIKVGLIPTQDALQALLDFVESYSGSVVIDPVLISSSGKPLVDADTMVQYKGLLPHASLLTPNIPELSVLSGVEVKDEKTIVQAAEVLLDRGVKAVLVKGGHTESLETATDDFLHDYFVTDQQSFWLHSKKQNTVNTRGTGCVLASAMTAALAHQNTLEDSVVIGKMLLNQGLRHGYSITSQGGEQKGPLKPLTWPHEARDVPLLTADMSDPIPYDFPRCTEQGALGLYPVVDRADWLERLLPLGVTTIQLRVKDLQGQALEDEIKKAIQIAENFQARLFINDYWSLAIQHGAYGVHLGQEDLETADLTAIAKAGLRLGLSTHCYYEVARAHAIKPSYLACGPVYHTDSKDMPWIPHGIDNLMKWKNLLPDYPWVAIGGINLQRLPQVMNTGVSGIAMISAITHADEPEEVTRTMLELLKNG